MITSDRSDMMDTASGIELMDGFGACSEDPYLLELSNSNAIVITLSLFNPNLLAVPRCHITISFPTDIPTSHEPPDYIDHLYLSVTDSQHTSRLSQHGGADPTISTNYTYPDLGSYSSKHSIDLLTKTPLLFKHTSRHTSSHTYTQPHQNHCDEFT
jgi:hypothetical protein